MSADRDEVIQSVAAIVQSIQNFISFVVGAAAFLTGGGFIVVNSHLAQFTDIHGYTIKVSQYLAAGVGLLIPPVAAAGIIGSLYYLGRILGRLSLRMDISPPQGASASSGGPLGVSANVLRAISVKRSNRQITFFIGLMFYTVLFGLFYGVYIYGSVPHYLGGGRPEPIVLVFTEADTRAALGLTPDPLDARRTQTVLLLAELEDGVIVADTHTGAVVAAKDALLIGRVDDQVAEQLITPTPAPTHSATPTP